MRAAAVVALLVIGVNVALFVVLLAGDRRERRREARLLVAAEAEPLMTLREALRLAGDDEAMKTVVRSAFVMQHASDAVWSEQQALFLAEPHPPG